MKIFVDKALCVVESLFKRYNPRPIFELKQQTADSLLSRNA